MKKIRRFLCLILVAALLFTLAAPAAAADVSYRGDINLDGRVNSSDARLALRAAARLQTLNDEQTRFGDMNADGKITSADARTILRMAAHLEPLVPFDDDPSQGGNSERPTLPDPDDPHDPAPPYEPLVLEMSESSIDLGYIDYGDSLSVSVTSIDEPEYNEEMDAYFRTFDIAMGDLHQLDGVAVIRLPYSTDYVEAGEDPAQCVAAMYYNPDAAQWEPVLYDVDADAQELVVYTDHFSRYGAFTFRNVSKRMTKVVTTSDLIYADPLAAAAAMQEYMNNAGQAGELCRSLARPYVETLLSSLKARANATADLMTNWSNIANLIMATAPGLESGVAKYLTTQELWKDFGYAGIACAAVSLAIQMTNDDPTPAEIANMYKDAMYLLISISQDSMLGTIGSAVWVVDRALTEMNTYGYNKVRDDLKACYRWYMEKENRWHGKPRTLPQWRTIIRNLSKQAQDKNVDAADLIMEEIDNYCGEFWTKGDQYIWEIYDELGQRGRGLPSEQMRREITDEFKGELLERLGPVCNAVKEDFEYEMRMELQKRLNKIVADLNSVTRVSLFETVADDEAPKYAHYTAAFEVADNGVTDPQSWQVTLDADGRASFDVTYIGYVLAGEPTKVDLYNPGQRVGVDQPERVIEFTFTEKKTEIPLKGGLPAEWGNGVWSMWERNFKGNATRLQVIDDHTIKWENVKIIETEEGQYSVEKVIAAYIGEYTVTPDTGALLVKLPLDEPYTIGETEVHTHMFRKLEPIEPVNGMPSLKMTYDPPEMADQMGYKPYTTWNNFHKFMELP